MSKKFGLVGLATVESKYLDGRAALNCSDETAAAIDEEVIAIIKESYDKALEMLRENRELMDKLAAFLIEKETITGKEFMQIFRKEKGIPEPTEEEQEKKEAESASGSTVDIVVDDAMEDASISEETEDAVTEEVDAKDSDDADTPDDSEPSKPQGPVGLFSNSRID